VSASSRSASPTSPAPRRSTRRWGGRGRRCRRPCSSRPAGWRSSCGSRENLAADSGLELGDGTRFGGIALAHNVRSREEVDAIVAAAASAGATVTRPPAETFYGGYAGVFTDPDGHPWEIAHNPGFALAEDGSLVLPDFQAQ
jgi:hypothetical protein